MKNNYSDFAVLAELVYVSSTQNLKNAGYRRPGLDALCEELKIERRGHSALDDAKILQTVCTIKSEEMLQKEGIIRTFQHQRMYHRLDVPADPSRPFPLSSRCKRTKLVCGIYDHTLG